MAVGRWGRLAAAGILVSLGVPVVTTVQASPASAAPVVRLLSASQWGPDLGGFDHAVGEVINDGPGIAGLVEVDLDFLNKAGKLLSTDFTFATVDDMNPPLAWIRSFPGHRHHPFIQCSSEPQFHNDRHESVRR